MSVQSFLSTSLVDQVDIMIRVDDDDPRFAEYRERFDNKDRIQIVVGSRGRGYNDLHLRYEELSRLATGTWTWMMDDDAWMVGENWADQLAKLEPSGCIVYPEWYFLGPSGYHRTGGYFPVVPNRCWEPESLSQPVDFYLTQLREVRGWQTTFLDGVTVFHDGRPRA